MSWHRKQYDNRRSVHHRTRGRRWVGMRHVVLIEEPVCRVCMRKPSSQVDHIIPLFKGGTDERSNLQGICDQCHDEKTARDLNVTPARKIGLDGYPMQRESINAI